MTLFKSIYAHLKKRRKQSGSSFQTKQSPVSTSLEQNLKAVERILGNSSDVIIRKFKIAGQIDAFLINLDGMTDQKSVSENIIRPLMLLETVPNGSIELYPEKIKESVVTAANVKYATSINEALSEVLDGETALFMEGSANILVLSTKGFEWRGVQEPQTETVVRGPREGFAEPLRVNTSLIRRRIKNPNLKLETITIGRQTKTNICIVYLSNVCDMQIVEELKKRLSQIVTDSIMGAGYIEQFIEDAPFSIFLTVGVTERPDVAAGKIMEGRIAVIVDGTPMVLTVPYLLMEGFQSPEDYLIRPFFATLTRWLRYSAFFLTTYLPGIYIALTTFHQEMIPTPLLLTMAAAREGTPFPGLIEALGMGIVFEFIREAGIRMPRPVGQAVSIVGALVIGQAAVQAGLVGAPMVIVTSLTAITVFVTPALLEATTVLRLGMTLAAGIAGLYGLLLLTLLVLIHIVSLRSFGVPYISPLAPLKLKDLKDILLKVPVWAMGTRPQSIGYKNPTRQGNNLRPKPPKN